MNINLIFIDSNLKKSFVWVPQSQLLICQKMILEEI